MFASKLTFNPLEIEEMHAFKENLANIRQGIKEGNIVDADWSNLELDYQAMLEGIVEKVNAVNQQTVDHQAYINDQTARLSDLVNKRAVDIQQVTKQQNQEQTQEVTSNNAVNDILAEL